MKKCPKCSKEFTDDIVYCTACNTPLEKVEQTTNTDTKNTQSETAYTQSTQTPQQNTQKIHYHNYNCGYYHYYSFIYKMFFI